MYTKHQTISDFLQFLSSAQISSIVIQHLLIFRSSSCECRYTCLRANRSSYLCSLSCPHHSIWLPAWSSNNTALITVYWVCTECDLSVYWVVIMLMLPSVAGYTSESQVSLLNIQSPTPIDSSSVGLGWGAGISDFNEWLNQSCLTLFNPVDGSLSGSSVHGLLQVRILEWVAIPFSRGSSQPRDQIRVSPVAGTFFTVWVIREALVNMTKLILNPVDQHRGIIALDNICKALLYSLVLHGRCRVTLVPPNSVLLCAPSFTNSLPQLKELSAVQYFLQNSIPWLGIEGSLQWS